MPQGFMPGRGLGMSLSTWQAAAVEQVLYPVDVLETAVDGYYIAYLQLCMSTGDEHLFSPLDGNHVDRVRKFEVFDGSVDTAVLFLQDKIHIAIFRRFTQLNLVFYNLAPLLPYDTDIIGTQDIAPTYNAQEFF